MNFTSHKIIYLSVIFLLSGVIPLLAENFNKNEKHTTKDVDLGGRVIYGSDDRKDWWEIKRDHPEILSFARASVAIFAQGNPTTDKTGHKLFSSRSLKASQQLCDGINFGRQKSSANCSGVLIAPDVVATAGHCVREISDDNNIPPLNKLYFVFGYHVKRENGIGTQKFSQNQIYTGKEIISGALYNDKDWAIIKLNRPVDPTVAQPVKLIKKHNVQLHDKIYVIGYPSGLPLKYAPNAEVRDNSHPDYFKANLDTFGGNSGSPVFDQKTNELIGILVRGAADYIPCTESKCYKNGKCKCNRQCNRVNICPTTGCEGEDVMRISKIPLKEVINR